MSPPTTLEPSEIPNIYDSCFATQRLHHMQDKDCQRRVRVGLIARQATGAYWTRGS
jgi:hypothetical protein